jgi:hypothetical protein
LGSALNILRENILNYDVFGIVVFDKNTGEAFTLEDDDVVRVSGIL